jgi:predicted AAA+ superfamily ATPase
MLKRHLSPLLLESLHHFPVVLLTGARQVGKSTLVQSLSSGVWSAVYQTLDNRNVLDAALTDPDGFLSAHSGPLVLDEVQRAPDLLRAIKFLVDQDRKPGRFLLTGSANLLTLKKVSETLAGRVGLHELYPFSASELSRRPHPPALFDRLFKLKKAEDFCRFPKPHKKLNLAHCVLLGGYPQPSLSAKPLFRSQWFEAYRKTYIERDVQELSAIERLSDFGRLMMVAASRTGQIFNASDLGREIGLPYATLHRYLSILEQTYQIFFVPPFFASMSKRLMKSPKLYWIDTGMACHLLGIGNEESLRQSQKFGALVESWVALELKKLIALQPWPLTLHGWRTRTGQEVDFLLEYSNQFIGIEVKSGKRIDPATFSHFKLLKESLKDRLLMSIVLYDGEEILPMASDVVAVPYSVFFL